MKETEIRPRPLFDRYLTLARRDVDVLFSDRSSFVDVPCPGCGSDVPEAGLQKSGFRYLTCRDCGSLYASPRPTPAMIDRFYREAESVRFWATHFFRETEVTRRKKMFRPRAEFVGGLAKEHSHAGVFADIGSGYGIFLEEVDRLGVFDQIVGVEPSPELAGICREKGFDVIEKPIEEVRNGELHASMTSAFEVLEHVFDPLRFIRAAGEVLSPGGILVTTTLTISGFDLQVLWGASKSITPPHHLNFLSTEGLEALVGRSGLELIALETPGVLDVDIVANMVEEDPSIEVPRFVGYLLSRRGAQTRNAFQQFLQENRLSSHVRVIARRHA